MRCPHCLKEISDDASFCGFCGKTISNHEDAQDLHDSSKANSAQTESLGEKSDSKTKKTVSKKKHIGLKVLLIFLIIALFAGFSLGFLCARGIINIDDIINKNQMKWTDFSEAYTETEQITENENPEGEKELSDGIPIVSKTE